MFNFKSEKFHVSRYDFIFSNNTSHKLTRHLVFWILFSVYFWVQSIRPEEYSEFFEASPYKSAFISFCCFIPVCLLTVYLFIYILLPVFLQKKNYLSFSFAFFSWFSVAIFINYFFAGLFLNNIPRLFLNNIHDKTYAEPNFINKFNFGYLNTIWAITIGLIALGIKLTKNWYQQQKENLQITAEKARTELRIQKAFIQPDFLLRSLQNIAAKIDIDSDDPGIMVLKLSDLLSYSLYQNEVDLVPLEKELSGLHDFISLEEKNPDYFFTINMQVNGDAGNKFIPPMIVLALLQKSVAMLHNEDSNLHEIIMKINILSDQVAIKIAFFNANNGAHKILDWEPIIQNAEKRLSVLFAPDEYQIEVTGGKGTVIMLNIPLANNLSSPQNTPDKNAKPSFYEPA
jgi:hypothetical protein